MCCGPHGPGSPLMKDTLLDENQEAAREMLLDNPGFDVIAGAVRQLDPMVGLLKDLNRVSGPHFDAPTLVSAEKTISGGSELMGYTFAAYQVLHKIKKGAARVVGVNIRRSSVCRHQ